MRWHRVPQSSGSDREKPSSMSGLSIARDTEQTLEIRSQSAFLTIRAEPKSKAARALFMYGSESQGQCLEFYPFSYWEPI